MSANYYGFEKFCSLLDDVSVLKKDSVISVIRMLQLCIDKIKKDVLKVLIEIDENKKDYYLDLKIQEIRDQGYLKEIDEKKFKNVLEELDVTVEELITFNYSSKLYNIIDVILSWETYFENYNYLFSRQSIILDYFLLHYANELISFLESKKTTFIKKSESNSKQYEFENLDTYSKLLYLFKELEKIKINIFREARNCGSAEAYHEIEIKYEDDIDVIKRHILEVIDDLYSQSKEGNIYYFDCPSGVYKNHFSNRMSNYFKEVPEANELDFLKSEIKYFSDPKKNRVLKRIYNYSEFIGNTEKYKITLRRKLEFLGSKLKEYHYKIAYKEDEFLEDPYLGNSIVGTVIKLVKDEKTESTTKNEPKEGKKSVYSNISFRYDINSTAEAFHEMHKNNNYFKDALSSNSNFLKELFEFLSDENRPVKTTYNIFDKTLNLYLISGHPLFYMRFSNPESVVIYPASLKMQYLEELKKRKNDLTRIYNKQTLRDEIKHTFTLRNTYKQKFEKFFSYDENLKNNAGSYSYILINSIERLLSTATIYFDDLLPDQILGLNDNKLNIVKSEIESNFKAYHNLIKFISLNHTPYLEHQAVDFISTTIQSINKRNFEYTYFYDILEKEANKISNEKVYEKIVQKNKLLETHHFFINGKPSNEQIETEKREDDKNIYQYRSNIFLNQNAQVWFNDTLQELSAIDSQNKPERSFQAICNAIFRDEKCKSIIFKNRLLLKNYITFLNDEYKAGIKSKSNLSNPQIYSIDVSDLINIYQNELLANKPE